MPVRLMKPASLERREGETWEVALARLPLRYPLIGMAKYDGIRAATPNGNPQSNSGKPFPNRNVMNLLREFPDHDGELIVGNPTDPAVCQSTQSVVMSDDADISNLRFFVFDHLGDTSKPFLERVIKLDYFGWHGFIIPAPWRWINNLSDLLSYIALCDELGYEGVILRDPKGQYKHGRTTLGCDRQGRPKSNEWGMLRIKPREDMEAVIVGWDYLYINTNEALPSELGYAKRSSAKDGKVRVDTVGSLRLKSKSFPDEYGLGIADPRDQAMLWALRDSLTGQIAKHTYQPYGSLRAPRQPQNFKGLRSRIDMDEEA